MSPAILLVDDQHDVLTLLHSALDTLRRPELEILEAASGEEALEQVNRRQIDLLVTDYRLPGMNGIELLERTRAAKPDTRTILITGLSDSKVRDDIRRAGAAAYFYKPIPLGDFLDAVERNLGLVQTIFPQAAENPPEAGEGGPGRLVDTLANLRQKTQGDAVFLISDRGLVVARAGDLRDSSMEVSLISALASSLGAGLKVARSNRQESLQQYSVFGGGDHDLILVPVNQSCAILLAGQGLLDSGRLLDVVGDMLGARDEIDKALLSMGANRERTTPAARKRRGRTGQLPTPEVDIESLLTTAAQQGIEPGDVDAFWDQAASEHANKPTSPDVISYEEARKMGLAPDDKQTPK